MKCININYEWTLYLFRYYFWFSHFYFWTTGIWYLTIQLGKRITLTPYWFQEWKTQCGKLNLRHSSHACNSKHYEEVSGGELLCGGWLIRADPIRSDIHVPFFPTTKPTKTLGVLWLVSLLSLTHTFTLYHTCLNPTKVNHFYLLGESMSIPCAIIVFEKKIWSLVPSKLRPTFLNTWLTLLTSYMLK